MLTVLPFFPPFKAAIENSDWSLRSVCTFLLGETATKRDPIEYMVMCDRTIFGQNPSLQISAWTENKAGLKVSSLSSFYRISSEIDVQFGQPCSESLA